MPLSGFLKIAFGAAISFALLVCANAQQAPSYQYSVRYNPLYMLNDSGRLASATIQSSNPGKIRVTKSTGGIIPNLSPPRGEEETIEIPRHPGFTGVLEEVYGANGDILITVYNSTSGNVVTQMGVGLISGTELKVFTEGERLIPFDINASGLMCGSTHYQYGHPSGTHPYGTSVPVVITRTGAVSTIPYPDPALNWGYYWNEEERYNEDNEGIAVAINSSGTVACTGTRHKDFADQEHFSFVSRGGTTIVTDLPAGATDINDSGEVVGNNGSNFWHYAPGSGVSHLYTTPAYYNPKTKISRDGVITIAGFDIPPIVIKDGTVYPLASVVSIPNNEFEIVQVYDMNDEGQIAVRTREIAISPHVYSTRILTPQKPTAVVNSVDDDPLSANASGCETGEFLSDGTPECTLRSAIQAANLGRISNIEFNIDGDGIPAIVVGTNLPVVDTPVTIDGTTQDGGWVEVKGNAGLDYGLSLTGGQSVIRGLIVNGIAKVDAAAIILADLGENQIAGCRIGTSADGNTAGPDFGGVLINNCGNNIIGGEEPEDANIIGGETGVTILGATSDDNKIFRNRIGMAVDGSSLGMNLGVAMTGGNRNQIGGESSSLGNRITNQSGILVVPNEAAMDGLTIQNNRIGLTEDGEIGEALGEGILLSGQDSHPFTNTKVKNNQIAGMIRSIWALKMTDLVIEGNRVGLSFDGIDSLPPGTPTSTNLSFGIGLEKCEQSNILNNTVAGYRFNVVVAGDATTGSDDNGTPEDFTDDSFVFNLPDDYDGEDPLGHVVSQHCTISGNTIGLVGSSPPDVTQQVGVAIHANMGDVTISDNTIAGHTGYNIWIQTGANFTVTGNEIGVPADATRTGNGIAVSKTVDAVIGTSEDGNLIGYVPGFGIIVEDANQNARVTGNRIGLDSTGEIPRPVGAGIVVRGDDPDIPVGTIISENIVCAAQTVETTGSAIMLLSAGATQVHHNTLGQDGSSPGLANRIGITIDSTEADISDNFIAGNTEYGILVVEHSEETPVRIAINSIFGNSGGTTEHGIFYGSGHPTADKLFVIRLENYRTGEVTYHFAVPSFPGKTGVVIEIFANDAGNPQGQTSIVRQSVIDGEGFSHKFVPRPDSEEEDFANFTVTATIDGSTGPFRRTTQFFGGSTPELNFAQPNSDQLLFYWLNSIPFFKLQTKTDLTRLWTDVEEPVVVDDGIAKVLFPLDDSSERFWQLALDAEKLVETDDENP